MPSQSNVCGLCDEAIKELSRVTTLRELHLLAPHNKAVTQRALHSLAPLRSLRVLAWQSDDLTALGPVMGAFGAFTTLRLLSLSCTPATVAYACGTTEALQRLLPYCHLDLIHPSAP